jgi:nucleoside-diphosphate-sugar epimerase
MSSKKNIFVTGGTGFIGSNLLDRLEKSEQYFTRALVRTPHARLSSIEYIHGELSSPDTYRSSLLDSSAVLHVAGEININQSLTNPRKNIESNLWMLASVLEEIRIGGKKQMVVFLSTDRVYGRTRRVTVTETEPLVPIEPYTAAKMLCEVLLETYRLLYGIPYIILRLDSVYGPKQPRSMFISDLIQKMLSGDTVEVGDLSTEKNFVYVDDVVDAILSALEAPESKQNTAYNIGGTLVSMEKIVLAVQKIIEARLEKSITILSKKEQGRPASIEVRPFRLSIAKAKKGLGWQPKTSLTEGITKTITYFLHEHETK